MKHSRRLLPLLLLVLLLAARIPLRGQTLLDDYRRDVLRYSRALKMAASASRAAGERLAVARTGYLPRLSLDGSFSVAMRRSEGAKPWSFGVRPSWCRRSTVAGRSARRSTRRRSGDDIALCDEEFTRFEVCYSAEYTYWNLSAMEEFAASMRSYVGLIRSLKEVVDYRFSEGYVARSDVLMIDARLSEAAYELLTAERNLAVARHNFNLLRGAAGEQQARLAQSIRDTLPLPARVAADEVLERRADLRAARLAGERAAAGVRAVRSEYNPRLSVGVGGVVAAPLAQPHGSMLLDGEAFVQLSVPIFHGGERRRAVRAARTEQARTVWQEGAAARRRRARGDERLDDDGPGPRAGRRLGAEPAHRGREPRNQHLLLRRGSGLDSRRAAGAAELDSSSTRTPSSRATTMPWRWPTIGASPPRRRRSRVAAGPERRATMEE